MNGVFIANMNVPKTCDDCLSGFVKTIGCTKRINFAQRDIARHPDCPMQYVADNDIASAFKPSTNYEVLISRTPEELAQWLCDMASWLPLYEGKVHPILKWLNQEATDEMLR